MKIMTMAWAVILGLLAAAMSIFIPFSNEGIFLTEFNSYIMELPNPGNILAPLHYGGLPFPYLYSISNSTLQVGPLALLLDFVVFFAIFLCLAFAIDYMAEKKREKNRIMRQELRYGRRKIKRR